MLMQLLFPETVLTRISAIQGPSIPLSWEGLCRGQEYQPGQLLLLLLPQAQKDSKNLCLEVSIISNTCLSSYSYQQLTPLTNPSCLYKKKKKKSQFKLPPSLFCPQLLNREQRAEVMRQRQAGEKRIRYQI